MSWARFFTQDQADELRELAPNVAPEAKPDAKGYKPWLQTHFPHVASQPMASRHERLWEWFEALEPGATVDPIVAVMPRGGGKSTTVELACAYSAHRLSRRFALYVCGTQDQAQDHMGSIETLLSGLGEERLTSATGSQKAGTWKVNQIRTARGFSIAGYGLDKGLRGIKLDEFRPDLIIFDDIDSGEDSTKTIEKKIAKITKAILPAGSSDCAIVVIQNLIRDDGIVARVVNRDADFLTSANIIGPEPALLDMEYESAPDPTGNNKRRWVITAGTPTWAGQSREVCERQMNAWGASAFLTEAQHDVTAKDGVFFQVSRIEIVDDLPDGHGSWEWVRAYDFGATEGGGDPTASVKMGKDHAGGLWVAEVDREQIGPDKVMALMVGNATKDEPLEAKIVFPQDPGAAGKIVVAQIKERLKRWADKLKEVSPTGKKAVRARAFQEQVALGNVKFVRGEWSKPKAGVGKENGRRVLEEVMKELRDFRENEQHDTDDVVDALSDATNELLEASSGYSLDVI
ncbi:MAG: hypothetical protein ACOYOL_07215 [Chthoniobacterales bacterium]